MIRQERWAKTELVRVGYFLIQSSEPHAAGEILRASESHGKLNQDVVVVAEATDDEIDEAFYRYSDQPYYYRVKPA